MDAGCVRCGAWLELLRLAFAEAQTALSECLLTECERNCGDTARVKCEVRIQDLTWIETEIRWLTHRPLRPQRDADALPAAP